MKSEHGNHARQVYKSVTNPRNYVFGVTWIHTCITVHVIEQCDRTEHRHSETAFRHIYHKKSGDVSRANFAGFAARGSLFGAIAISGTR